MIHNDFSNQGALEHALEHWKLQNELYIIITECLFIKYCSSGKNHFFEVFFFLFQKGSYLNARLTWNWKCRKKNRKVEIFILKHRYGPYEAFQWELENSNRNRTVVTIDLFFPTSNSPTARFFQLHKSPKSWANMYKSLHTSLRLTRFESIVRKPRSLRAIYWYEISNFLLGFPP